MKALFCHTLESQQPKGNEEILKCCKEREKSRLSLRICWLQAIGGFFILQVLISTYYVSKHSSIQYLQGLEGYYLEARRSAKKEDIRINSEEVGIKEVRCIYSQFICLIFPPNYHLEKNQ